MKQIIYQHSHHFTYLYVYVLVFLGQSKFLDRTVNIVFVISLQKHSLRIMTSQYIAFNSYFYCSWIYFIEMWCFFFHSIWREYNRMHIFIVLSCVRSKSEEQEVKSNMDWLSLFLDNLSNKSRHRLPYFNLFACWPTILRWLAKQFLRKTTWKDFVFTSLKLVWVVNTFPDYSKE